MSDQAPEMPPAAVVVRYPVEDFDRWKKVFDGNESGRVDGGIIGHHINRAEDDPNNLAIYLGVADLDKAKAFTGSDELRERMKDAGVAGPPEFTWMTTRRQDIVWDRERPAFIIAHTVADFDAWLEGYDGADDLRQSKGIVGHAANQSHDDPSLAVVYHQAESFDDLRSFLGDPALKEAMDNAGVTSEPDVSFWTGGWGKQY